MRLLTLCLLYLAQGLPWGFVTVTLAAWLASREVSTEAVGEVLAMALAPWAGKVVLGPIVDARRLPGRGRRRSWILLAQGGMALTLPLILTLPDPAKSTSTLGALLFLHNGFAALQDVAVDAYAVDRLPAADRGRANGFMYGSKYLGGWVGGALLSAIIGRIGLPGAVLVQCVAIVAIALLVFRLDEEEGGTSPKLWARLVELARSLGQAFTRRATLLLGVVLWVRYVATGLVAAVSPTLFVQHLHWTQERYGAIVGGAALLTGLAGSVGGGWLADRVGARRQFIVATVLQLVGWLAFAASPALWPQVGFMTAFSCWDSFLDGLCAVALFSICMGSADPRIGATFFTACMALMNLGSTHGSTLAWIPERWGWSAPFQVAAAVAGLSLLVAVARPEAPKEAVS